VSEVGEPPAVADDPLRLFVALELPEPVRAALISWRDRALRGARAVRPLGAESLHVTLCFLGWRAAGDVQAIAAACRAVSAEPAPVLSLGGPRWLPPRRPRVLAVELHDRDGALTRAQARLSEVLAAGGWYEPEKRPYLPHVTVARVARGGRAATDLPPPPGASPFSASMVVLYRSRLLRSGASYEALSTVELRVAR
jgi:RNA 2',3'-cyclic 3'-phosphodiesterase